MNTMGLRGEKYKPFTEDELKEIDNAVMEILEDVGIEVNSENALNLLKENGAIVNEESKIVRFPRSMVEDAIEKAPSSVILRGREEKNDLYLEENRVHFGTGGTVLSVLDIETGEKRKINIKDVADIARLVDALDNIHFLVIPVYPNECDADNVDINRFYASIRNTSKHIMGGIYSMQGIHDVIDMAAEIAGSKKKLRERPFISFITTVISPLRLDKNYTDFLIEIAKEGLPVAIPAEPLAGGTGPMTIAGNIVEMTAESLSGLVVAQLANPGTPVIFASTASAMDMRSAAYLTGSVEMGLMQAGLAQVAQYYKLPLYSTSGMSDSKIPDIQAGYEKAITSMLVGMAGANFIHDAAGLLEFCMTASYEQYVIDDEIIGMVMRAVRGIEVNKDTLAADVIKNVGPGGHFLTQEHTIKYMRSEYFQPEISDRQRREQWVEDGALDARQRALKKAKLILDDYKPMGIDKKIDNLIRDKYKEKLLEF
jgi:trimethylamine---corrinoid protein Co-methyltransferase